MLRPRTARQLRGAPGTPSPEVAKSRGACSLPQSPTPSRRSSSADCSWETQSVLSSSSPFSTDGISRNGTTFSSRHNKYLIHCAKRVDDEHYLTPTQRTTRDLKRLRGLLDKAHETIQQKDAEIHRLKQEVISLRLRASSQGDSADRLTPHHPDPADPGQPEMKEKYNDKVEGLLQKLTEANGRYFEIRPLYDASRLRVGQLELELEKVRSEADRRAETREMSAQTTPDPSRTELTATSTQCASVQTSAAPLLVAAQSQTAPAETAVEPAKSAETPKTDTTPAPKADSTWEEVPLNEFPTAASGQSTVRRRRQRRYRHTAAASKWYPGGSTLRLGIRRRCQHRSEDDSVRVTELTQRLSQTETELERVRFLKSAVFHYLTDKDDYVGHMRAISAVLQFSEWEQQEVERVRARKNSHA
ncbi:hypothetical protein FJT64_027761 [Amphibalanus amphitrite]|uniref:GRIP domain-containing protein n=1 Tax=Amphibalanus amphitrite TaxID=1232801 RepID=A0A6A4VTS1_AMPAM|nr:hypothetical protein FJT64_027761 [Amphibalanus amphitrite]